MLKLTNNLKIDRRQRRPGVMYVVYTGKRRKRRCRKGCSWATGSKMQRRSAEWKDNPLTIFILSQPPGPSGVSGFESKKRENDPLSSGSCLLCTNRCFSSAAWRNGINWRWGCPWGEKRSAGLKSEPSTNWLIFSVARSAWPGCKFGWSTKKIMNHSVVFIWTACRALQVFQDETAQKVGFLEITALICSSI